MSTFGFDTEEKVLSYHGPLLYEASVIDRTVRQAPDGVTKIKLYLLHYSGWNSHWDEWVPESRLLKHNPQNLRVQKERVKEFQRAHKKRALELLHACLLYTSPSPRDRTRSRMPSSA